MLPKRVRVLIVDDSALVRHVLSEVLATDPEIEVVGTAIDPFFAVARIRENKPDVIVLDIELPRMDGVTFLRKLMRHKPIPTVVCSTLAESGSLAAVMALEAGAVDIIAKPAVFVRQFLEDSRDYLCAVVKAAALAKLPKVKRSSEQSLMASMTAVSSGTHMIFTPSHDERRDSRGETTDRAIAFGASTGGTEALRAVLTAMPEDSPAILVVQHMPEGFTSSFAQRLDQLCAIRVKEARSGDTLCRGQALIARGDRHLEVRRVGARIVVQALNGDLINGHRPSVDVLFRSVASTLGPTAVGVLLTGMGCDGAEGLLAMRNAGAMTFAQDESSSIVFGMPAAAIAIGAACAVLPLSEIATATLRAIASSEDASQRG
jgi:two-component system chemotaxis response regulator CheB